MISRPPIMGLGAVIPEFVSMIDRSESDLIAQEQRNRSGTTGVSPGAAVHGGDRAARRKRAAASGQSARIEPSIGPVTAAPPVRPKQ
jgi:hypothetical protein